MVAVAIYCKSTFSLPGVLTRTVKENAQNQMGFSGFDYDFETLSLYQSFPTIESSDVDSFLRCGFRLQLFIFFCYPFLWLCANSSPAILVKYMGDWRVAPWSSKQSPPGSHSEPRLTSRLHFQQVPPFITRQGYWRGGRGGYSRGPVEGQCVPLTPPMFFPTGCWEYRALPQTAATLLSYNLYNVASNLFRGGETCSLLLLPCSFTFVSRTLLFCSVLPIALFLWLSSLSPLPPLCLSGPTHTFLPTGASFLLLCSASPGPSVWVFLIAKKK